MKKEPYVYINCSQFDEKEARKAMEIFESINVKAYVDDDVFKGIFWTGKRQELIRNCSVMIDLNCSGLEYVSHVRMNAISYADLMEIQTIEVDSDERYYDYHSCQPPGFRGSVFDDDFSDKIKKALEDSDWPDMPERKDKDLVAVYYDKPGMRGRAFSYKHLRFCNLRTHEVSDSDWNRIVDENGNRLKLSEKKLYIALSWLKDKYWLFSRSDSNDYTETYYDLVFIDELNSRHCKPPVYLQKWFNEESKKMSYDGPPYMDEFEYIDSLM